MGQMEKERRYEAEKQSVGLRLVSRVTNSEWSKQGMKSAAGEELGMKNHEEILSGLVLTRQ